jgi:AbrB family looped-hinge helix DNA binding protein
MTSDDEPAALHELRIGPQGRIVIPAPLRRAMGIETGDALLAHAEGGTLVLESRDATLRRLQAAFSGVREETDLAEELIADRRAEAARERDR